MSHTSNIILIGFSGTGKSRAGAEVARLLGWQSIDLDDVIARRAGMPVHRIFSELGEPAFRKLESEAVREACAGERRVIATGGGAFADEANRALMLERGFVVCLEARPQTILKRLQAQEEGEEAVRPMLAAKDPLARIVSLKAQRQPAYSLAHWTVHTDSLTEAEVAQEVARAYTRLQPSLFRADPDLAATVTHSGGSYPVLVGWGLLDRLGEAMTTLGLTRTAYIIADEGVYPFQVRRAQRSLHAAGIVAHVYVAPAGEASKTLDMARHIHAWLIERRIERGHAIVALGGGVVGDLAGFVAATILRGVAFVQAPTSLLAMVDASIGGKVAVDLPEGKNLVGAFYQPRLVAADPSALASLPERARVEGWAEAVKHGLILDEELFRTFEERADALLKLESEITTQVIRRSMAIKADVVSRDERETTGLRVLLNYGHTIGHAIEVTAGYGRYLHGEAVGIGMMGAARISARVAGLPEEAVERQRRLFERLRLPTRAEGVDPEAVLAAMSLDKKVEAGAVRWVLLERIGQATERRDVPPEVVREAVRQVMV